MSTKRYESGYLKLQKIDKSWVFLVNHKNELWINL